MADPEDAPWYRPLLTGVGALLGVSLLVGGVISVIALGAVNVTGLGEPDTEAQVEPSLYLPEDSGQTEDEDESQGGLTLEDLTPGRDHSTPAPSPRKRDREGVEAKDGQKKEPKRKPPRSRITLSASPLEVAPMERIYLTGTYPGGEGASLQVQRRSGGWDDFPTSTSVSGGTFSTYVMTGRSGVNRFRVVDKARGKRSNVVTVRVR